LTELPSAGQRNSDTINQKRTFFSAKIESRLSGLLATVASVLRDFFKKTITPPAILHITFILHYLVMCPFLCNDDFGKQFPDVMRNPLFSMDGYRSKGEIMTRIMSFECTQSQTMWFISYGLHEKSRGYLLQGRSKEGGKTLSVCGSKILGKTPQASCSSP